MEKEERKGWKITTVNIMKEGTLLPPAPHLCQACAIEHHPTMPHNCQSMFFQYWFYQQNDRFPSWLDAMSHCSPEIQEQWKAALIEKGQNLEHRGIQ
jgi:hypothetical protein